MKAWQKSRISILILTLILFLPEICFADAFMAGPAWIWFLLFFFIYSLASLPGLFFGLFFTVKELLIGALIISIFNLGLYLVIEYSDGSSGRFIEIIFLIFTLTFISIIGSIIGNGFERIRTRRVSSRFTKKEAYLVSAMGLFILSNILINLVP